SPDILLPADQDSAADFLAHSGEAGATALLNRLKNTPQDAATRDFRQRAARALSTVYDRRIGDALVPLAGDTNPRIQDGESALQNLAILHDDRVPALFETFAQNPNSSPDKLADIGVSLANMDDPRGPEALKTLLLRTDLREPPAMLVINALKRSSSK